MTTLDFHFDSVKENFNFTNKSSLMPTVSRFHRSFGASAHSNKWMDTYSRIASWCTLVWTRSLQNVWTRSLQNPTRWAISSQNLLRFWGDSFCCLFRLFALHLWRFQDILFQARHVLRFLTIYQHCRTLIRVGATSQQPNESKEI